MTQQEFASACSGPLESVYGAIDTTTVRMYFSFLGDFEPKLLAAAVAKCICELKWLPKISEIRQAAVEIARGTVKEMTVAEAWGHAFAAIKAIDFDSDGSVDRAIAKIPAKVYEAMKAAGLGNLVNGKREWACKLFSEAYRDLMDRERRELLACPQVRREIEERRAVLRLPPTDQVKRVAAAIGAPK